MTSLRAETIRALLTEPEPVCPRIVTVLESVDSTNRWMSERARAGEVAHGDLVVADTQSGGRGRRDRTWTSPPGVNVYASMLVDAPLGPAGLLVYVAGLAVSDAAEALAGIRPFLKWPNDCFIGARKLCGILCESVGVPGAIRVVVGIGLNVNATPADFGPDIRDSATSLAIEADRLFDRNEVVARLYHALMSRYNLLATDARRIVDDWKVRAGLPNVRYRVRLDSGEIVGGRVHDLAVDGALVLQTDTESRAIYTGDVVSWRVD
ncbi:MAG: biotin--[acetyl-CoA-carboxylase] ligase [Deltaproteobacteria bacterium]|nr:biotin--[acetyl-CoA-carboxylase] ligase [Deltaproteobacteria bacterium]